MKFVLFKKKIIESLKTYVAQILTRTRTQRYV